MLTRLRDYDFPDTASDLRGSDVYGTDGEKLGTVDDVLLDDSSGDVRYLLVDRGILSAKKFVVPIDEVFGATDDDTLVINSSKTEVENLPDFRDESIGSAGAFARYEAEHRRAWGSKPRRSDWRPSPLVSRLRETLRSKFASLRQRREPIPMPASSESTSSSPVASGIALGVYALYHDRDSVERGVSDLKDAGFSNTDISVVMPQRDQTKNFAIEHATKAPEGALAGGSTGLLVGGTLGWLAGIGAVAMPGFAPLIAAGPLVATITGAGVGSAIGGLAGALIGVGVPEYEAKRYEEAVKKGDILLSVQCSDPRFSESARKLLERSGARDVFVSGEKRAA